MIGLCCEQDVPYDDLVEEEALCCIGVWVNWYFSQTYLYIRLFLLWIGVVCSLLELA